MYSVLRAAGVPETDAEVDADALEAVENLLESYFVQIDGTFDKLEAIGASQHIYVPTESQRATLETCGRQWCWLPSPRSGPCVEKVPRQVQTGTAMSNTVHMMAEKVALGPARSHRWLCTARPRERGFCPRTEALPTTQQTSTSDSTLQASMWRTPKNTST